MSNEQLPFENMDFEEFGENSGEKSDRRFFKQEKKQRTLFERLMYDNRVVFAFSVVCALCIWFYVTLYAGDTVTRTVSDVPVTINYEDSTPANLGLEMFGNTDFTVKVTVSGPRYRVSERSLSASDILCTANLNYVNSAGLANLDLRVTCNMQDVTIESKSLDSVSVYFDKPAEKEVAVEAYTGDENANLAARGYMTDSPVTSLSRIKISGPASEVNSIDKIVAVATCEGNLSESVTIDATLKPVMTDETELKYSEYDDVEVTVTIPVRKIVTLPATVTFTSIPFAYRENLPRVTVTPAYVSCGVLTKDAETVSSVSVGQISFDDLDNKTNRFTFDNVSGDVIVIGDVTSFTATVDTSGYSKKNIEIELGDSNLIINGAPSDVSVSRGQQTLTVTVIGPEKDIANLSADSIYAEVDLTNVNVYPGNFLVECFAHIRNSNTCWCYGDYEVELSAMTAR